MARFSFRSVLWQPPKPASGPTLIRLSSVRQSGALRHRPVRNWSTQWGTPELRPATAGRPLPWIGGARRHRTIAPVGDQWRPPFAPPPPVIPREWIIAGLRHRVTKATAFEWAPPPRNPARPLSWVIGAPAIRHRVGPQSTEWTPPTKPASTTDRTPTWLISARARRATRIAQIFRSRVPAEVIVVPPSDRTPPWTILARGLRHRSTQLQSREWAPPLALPSTDRVPPWLTARSRRRVVPARSLEWGPSYDPPAPPRWSLVWMARHRPIAARATGWSPAFQTFDDRVPGWLLHRLPRHRGAGARTGRWGAPADTTPATTVRVPAWCVALTVPRRRTVRPIVRWLSVRAVPVGPVGPPLDELIFGRATLTSKLTFGAATLDARLRFGRATLT